MKTFVIGLLAIISASTCAFAASPAATQDWVRHYVSTNTSGGGVSEQWVRDYVSTNVATYGSQAGSIVRIVTNGWSIIIGYGEGGTNDWVMMKQEYPDKLALQVTNATAEANALGVTNNMLFAWNKNGEFWNAPAGVFISCVSTNCFRFNGVDSIVTNGLDTFVGYFSVVGTKIAWSENDALLPTQQSNVRGASLLDLFIGSAFADTWDEVEWYNPNTTGNPPGSYTWQVTDKEGNYSELTYDNSDPENPKVTNLNEVLDSMKSTVNSVMKNMVDLSKALVEVNNKIYRIDAQMKEMYDNLNKFFSEAWAKMDKIEKQLEAPTDDGGSEEEKVVEKIIEKKETKIIIEGGVKPLKVDGKTIGVEYEKTENARYQLKNFPGAWGTNVGLYPVIGNQSGHVGELMWIDPWSYFDGDSLKVDRSDSCTHLPSKQGDKHGFHIAGWYTPTAAPYHCDETIASNLGSDDEDMHYVLTKKFEGSEAGSMHYMKIGKIGGGSAFKFIGTDNHGEVVGYGSRTNNVTFASKAGSNIEVSVSKSGDDVTISIGAYWVQ